MKTFRISLSILIGIFLLLAIPLHSVFAAEAAQNEWRATYDLIMRYLNFLILAAVIYKFGKAPILQFLQSQSEEVQAGIKVLEEEKDKISLKISETLEMGKESDTRFKYIQEKIIQEGERKKQEIIDDAHKQSKLILDESKRKVNFLITNAKIELKSELIDMATEMAIERLPKVVTVKDNDRFTNTFLDVVAA